MPFLLPTLSIFQQQLMLEEDSLKAQKIIYSQFSKAVVPPDVSSNTILKVLQRKRTASHAKLGCITALCTAQVQQYTQTNTTE